MKNITVISDFDKTIAKDDLLEVILDKFTTENWRIYDILVENEKITLDEALNNQYSMLNIKSEKEVIELIKNFTIRDKFKELIEFCKNNSIKFIIASAGMDIYINYFLEKLNIKDFVEIYCVKVYFKNNKIYKNFKEELVYKYKKNSYVIFIGDGYADFIAARNSDKIFAVKDSLMEKLCIKYNLDYIAIEDFSPVIDYLKTLMC